MMIKLIPIKWLVWLFGAPLFILFFIILAAYALISQNFPNLSNVFAAIGWAVTATSLLLLYAQSKWRCIWKIKKFGIGDWLSDTIFPDLNGFWDVVLESNEQIIKDRMSGKPFDANIKPTLSEYKLLAEINQGWFHSSIEMEKTEDPRFTMDSSRSIIFDFNCPDKTSENRKRIGYIYYQVNNPLYKKPLDSNHLYGAGLLEVSKEGDHLKGDFFTNRAWVYGENTAGTITLTRRV